MDARTIIKRTEDQASSRGTWEQHWQECADYALPHNNQVITKTTPGGQKRTEQLFSLTAARDLHKMASGIYSQLFPLEHRAFALVPEEETEDDDAGKWCSKVTEIMHEELLQSNFRQAYSEFLRSLGCFGTACMWIGEGRKRPLHFRTHYMPTVYIMEDYDGVIDTVFRPFTYTARQAYQAWGDECGEKVLKAAKDPKKQDKKFSFIHAVYPRESNKRDSTGKPFASKYVSVDDKKEVSESGYDEMPYLVARWDKDEFEIYGRSPTMLALAEAKMHSSMWKSTIEGAELNNHPPMLVPDDGSVYPPRTSPRSIIYYNSASGEPKPYQSGTRTDIDLQMLQEIKLSIHQSYFIDIFQMLQEKTNITATQAMGMIEEKKMLLNQVVSRQQGEFLSPMIHRVLAILARAGRLEVPPPSLEGYKVEYLGKLALALQAIESTGFRETLLAMSAIGEVSPAKWQEILDNFDLKKVVRDIARNNGTKESWLREEDLVDQIQQQRKEMMQQQAMLQQAPDVAKAYKDATEGIKNETEGTQRPL